MPSKKMEEIKFTDEGKELHASSGDAIILELIDEQQWVLFQLTFRQAKQLGEWLLNQSK